MVLAFPALAAHVPVSMGSDEDWVSGLSSTWARQGAGKGGVDGPQLAELQSVITQQDDSHVTPMLASRQAKVGYDEPA